MREPWTYNYSSQLRVQCAAAAPNLRCHLTFIRFAGPRKERIHLGAAIAAVVAAGVDDVSNFPSIRELAAFGHRPARRIPP
jgi:hypothetical protein